MRKVKWRRVLPVLAVPVLALGIVSPIFDGADAKGEPVYDTVTVYAGDTLWEIAKKHNPEGDDIRDVLYGRVLIEVNGEKVPYAKFDVSKLIPGMVVHIEKLD